MRLIVFPHDLEMGGSQMNAIELAAAVGDLGVEATVFGRPGALNARIEELGLEFVEAPRYRFRPTPAVVKALIKTARDRDASVLHGYEWPPTLECYLASAALPRTVAVSTVMSMSVAAFLPKAMPLLVGTEQIAAHERASGRVRVDVLEPPVDLAHNVRPPSTDVADLRNRYGIAEEDFLLVCVTRLAHELKAEGLLTAIKVAGAAPAWWRLKLLIVGDGPARGEMERAAALANVGANGHVVTLTGQLMDPRPAYAAADAVLGMGGSALRALAFAKPLIVQGEKGYFRLLEEGTVQEFLWQGWYGVGSHYEDAQELLSGILERLVGDEELMTELSTFGHNLVNDRFSLTAAARRQVEIYEKAIANRERRGRVVAGLVRATPPFATYHGRRIVERLTKRTSTDDFNAQPLAATQTREPHRTGTVVYIAGVNWDSVPGTDRRLVDELRKDLKVYWVDPPIPLRAWKGTHERGAADAGDLPRGITRVRTTAPPGISYPLSRDIARHLQRRSIEKALSSGHDVPLATVLANPTGDFPNIGGLKCLYLTDDWIAGAPLMGLSEPWVRRNVNALTSKSDVICAVSPALLENPSVHIPDHARTAVIPNGCEVLPALHSDRPDGLPRPYAVLIGQLNERLDIGALIATAGSGLHTVVIGPRVERDPEVSSQLTSLLEHPCVSWLGRRSQGELRRYMEHAAVGLTPYRDNAFNRGSFPLKTLEYLANGLPVVSSDLPASRWLDCPDVAIASDPSEFARLALTTSQGTSTLADRRRRVDFAGQNTWRRRAQALLTELDLIGSTVAQPNRSG